MTTINYKDASLLGTPAATGTISAADKAKLDGIAANATANTLVVGTTTGTAYDGALGAANVTFPGFGTSSATAAVGNDARLSDARTRLPSFSASITMPNNTTLDTTVFTVPASPSGINHFNLERLSVRLDTAVTGAGSVVISVGLTAGGQDFILNTAAVTNATAVGVLAGSALLSLGALMLAANGFEALLAAGATIVVRCISTGAVTAGAISVKGWGDPL